MAGVSLTVTDDLGRIVSRLETAIEHVEDFRPMWRRIQPAWEARGREMFRTQGRSTGTPWPSYDQTIERAFYLPWKSGVTGRSPESLMPLRWPGNREVLAPSLMSTRDPYAVYRYGRTRLVAGTDVPYAGNHDRGVGRAPERMGGHAIPRRPLLGFGRTFVRAVAEASREHALSAELVIDSKSRRGRSIGLTSAEVNALRGRGR